MVLPEKNSQQTVSIQMSMIYAPLLADIFLYAYEAEFIQSFLSTGKKQLASRFNLFYRYIDDALSINKKIASRFNLFYRYIDDALSINNPDFWARCIPLNLISRIPQRTQFCFSPRFTTVDWEGWSFSHFHLRQTR